MDKKSSIYREQSLKSMSSPDQLDQLLRIIRPPRWILLGAVASGLMLALVWSIFGRIPQNAAGSAILVHPKQVVPMQFLSDGPIVSIDVQIGDRVSKGDLIARLDLPTLEKQLEQEQARLVQFRSRSGELSVLERALAESEQEHIKRQARMIEERIEIIDHTSKEHQRRSADYILKQRDNINISRRLSLELGEALEERLTSYRDLKVQGLVSGDPVVSAQGRSVENQISLSSLDLREQELELKENTALESFNRDMDQIRDLRIRLSDLALKEMEIAHRLRATELDDATTAEEIKRKIEGIRARIQTDGHLYSEFDGRVLEITATTGEMAHRGQRLGKMEVDVPDAELMALAYFEIKDGKAIAPGHPIRISPATVERERFGGIIGHVVEVTDYPITTDAAANQIGDLEIAQGLLNNESRIGVIARLDRASTPTGFKWTSGEGPDLSITPGTTAQVRVTTEERPPITFVLPFLRSLIGV